MEIQPIAMQKEFAIIIDMKKTIIISLIASSVSIFTWEWMHHIYGIDDNPQQVVSIK
jgi:hypothetical protein